MMETRRTSCSTEEATEEVTETEARDFDIEMTFVGDCCMASDLENGSEGSMLWSLENLPDSYFFE